MKDLGSPVRLRLPVHDRVRFVLVRPHYPENLGASARALKAMGFHRLVLVKPGRLCVKEHDMAFKMAVKSWDVLDRVETVASVEAAIAGAGRVLATTARSGVRGATPPRRLAPDVVQAATRGEEIAILLGNEKTGLSDDELACATHFVRIPMAASQPSVNLAQSVQILAYELLIAALDHREQRAGIVEP
ncbi:MAG: RNA methyltransferase [Pseudomonadota bacterium]